MTPKPRHRKTQPGRRSFWPLLLVACAPAFGAATNGARAQDALPAAAEGAGVELSADRPVQLSADQLEYDLERGLVIASGEVEIAQGGSVLTADTVTYRRSDGTITAEGGVALVVNGQALFAERMSLDDELAGGLLEGVRLLLSDGSRLAAARAERGAGATGLDRAVYSPCPVCAENPTPLWRIKAERVVWDEASGNIIYRNARFEVGGVPVLFTPYFYHPDPTVERRSGLLAPEFGTDTLLGLTVRAPVHYVLGPSRDVTITPLFSTEERPVVGFELRDLDAQGPTLIGGSATYTDAYRLDDGSPEEGREWRGHFEGAGSYDQGDDRVAGFEVRLASDNTYLARYDISDDDVLENRAYLERFSEDSALSVEGLAFQGLRPDDEQGLIPVVLPYANATFLGERDRIGGRWRSSSNGYALTRVDGLDSRRLSTEVSYSLPGLGERGDLRTLNFALRGDLYNTRGEEQAGFEVEGSELEARTVPQVWLDWSLPLARTLLGWQTTVAPLASLSYVPNGLNDRGIPNEDSLEFELDETNIFDVNRFTGIDRVESGLKLAYGARFDGFGPGGWRVSGLLAQSLREGPDGTFEDGSGLAGTASDIVGRLDLQPDPLLDVNLRFRLSHDELALRRGDIRAEAGPPALRANLQLLTLSEDLPGRDIDARRELTAGLRVQVNRNLALAGQTRQNLEQNTPISNMFGFVYTHPCLVVVGGLERSFTDRGELEDETRVSLRLSLRNLGGLGATSEFDLR